MTSDDPPSGDVSHDDTEQMRSSSVLNYLRDRAQTAVSLLRRPSIDVEPYDEDVHGPLISYDGISGQKEVERYWVNKPYAFASITFDPDEKEHCYHVIEPELSEFQQTLLDALLEDAHDTLVYRADTLNAVDRETILKERVVDLLEEYGVSVDMNTFYRLFYYVDRTFRGYGKIDALMRDPNVEDISCDGYNLPVFIYHSDYTDIRTNLTYQQDELDDYVVRLAQLAGRHISIGTPATEATLPDGSRAELALGEEVTPRGSAFTIRRYSEDPFTPVDLVHSGTFSVEMLAYLWLCIENNKSLIFAGGTASGKTTSLNAISMFIPPRSKVLSIEDTRELTLSHDNWLASQTRETQNDETSVDMYDLLRSALRHRPEYIIVGEVRGEEALTLFQAMNTGHTTISTMHADSIHRVINRLENEPINVPRAMIQSLDLVSIQTLVKSDGERVRRCKSLVEVGEMNQQGDLEYSSSWDWDPESDAFYESDSTVLAEIQDSLGMDRTEFLRELQRRQDVLQFMVDYNINDYRRFTRIINEYHIDPDAVMDRIERVRDGQGNTTTDILPDVTDDDTA